MCAIVFTFTPHDNNCFRRIRIIEQNTIPYRVNIKYFCTRQKRVKRRICHQGKNKWLNSRTHVTLKFFEQFPKWHLKRFLSCPELNDTCFMQLISCFRYAVGSAYCRFFQDIFLPIKWLSCSRCRKSSKSTRGKDFSPMNKMNVRP